MSYKIGNTVVIDNNAALGSIDGNSLNLANNANISGGGSGSLYTTTTPGATAGLGSSVTLAFVVGGGGGAQSNVSPSPVSPNVKRFAGGGSGAGTSIFGFDTSSTPTIDVTVGAAGDSTAPAGNPGGISSIASPNLASTVEGAYGLVGGLQPPSPGSNPGSPAAIYTYVDGSTPNTFNLQANNFGMSFNGRSGISGAPTGPTRTANFPTTGPNYYSRGGSSLFSLHNQQSPQPTGYTPGNNFGFGQGAVSLTPNSQYLNVPGNMSNSPFTLDANVKATAGCVLLIGF